MAELLIAKNHNILFRIPLTEKGLTIGRSHVNDISLPDPDISRSHAEIIYRNGEFYLIDKSSSGTLIGNAPIQESRLNDRDEIGMGAWRMTFREEDKRDNNWKDDTQTLSASKKIKESTTKVLRLDSLQDRFIVTNPVFAVGGQQGGISPWPSNADRVLIGSDPGCDLVIRDDYVSAKHCIVSKEGDHFILKDLGSTNGTRVNGKKIHEVPLSLPTSFTVGETIITFKEMETKEEVVPANREAFCRIVGATEVMRRLYAKIEIVAPTPHMVLIQGETGSGKELVARALHELSDRHLGPYVILNCGAIAPNLIESELFGHEKGAYTGAYTRGQGAFEQAEGGTLFLDEIGELPIELQPKLLRVLENKTIRRIRGEGEIPVNVRIVAATNRSLVERIAEGKFRADLFYRLSVIPLLVPSLKERKEDIPLLVNRFLQETSVGRPKTLSQDALDKLIGHSWPGNVRELKNTLLRGLIFCKGDTLKADDMDLFYDGLKPGNSTDLGVLEKQKILETLNKTEGNKTKAAALLGIAKSTLFKKLKDYGIPT